MHVSLNFIRRLVPRGIRRLLGDTLETWHRWRVPAPSGLPQYGLGPTQIYPEGAHLVSVLQTATAQKLSGISLKPTTPVASIGTCFAEEFAYFMGDKGFNYIRTEDDALAASANWGRVYTVPNFLQIVRYSTDPSYPLLVEQTTDGWFDPLREPRVRLDPGRKAAEHAIRDHRRASEKALTQCEVLIVTLGQNEAWVDSKNSVVWAVRPKPDVFESRPDDFRVIEFGYVENVAALQEAVGILASANPGIRILFTVSPVASYASFSDMDVVSASFANKCLLRAVVQEVVRSRPGKLFYFPSFEIALCDNPGNFRADNRHVKYATIDRIFSVLTQSTSLR